MNNLATTRLAMTAKNSLAATSLAMTGQSVSNPALFLDSPEEPSSDDDRSSGDESSSAESSSDQSEDDQNMDVDRLPSLLLQAACGGNVEHLTEVLDELSVDKSESKYSRAELVNVKNERGDTALSLALSQGEGHLVAVRTLVSAGADIDAFDRSGQSPLVYALCHCSLLIVRELIELGADVNRHTKYGDSPLLVAVGREDCLQLLIEAGADLDARCRWFAGETALMSAVVDNRLSCLKMLLEAGANVNVKKYDGETALCIAFKRILSKRYLNLARADLNLAPAAIESLTLLLSYGADVNIRNADGDTALMHMTKIALHREETGGIGFLQFFILNGAMPPPSTMAYIYKGSVYKPYGSSSSVLEIAVKESNCMTIKYLIATCYLLSADLTLSADTFHRMFRRPITQEAIKILHNLQSQPWPLVKLCFVAVSTAFGASPGRQERVKNSQLPPKLQRMLLFQEPWSRLCVNQWDKIPLTFSPDDYKNLPQPRPLLYNWPVGRALVPCDCGYCDGTMYKYDQEEEDTENGGE